jgi:precorrin-6A/cobalt-precorrin-6A reductase
MTRATPISSADAAARRRTKPATILLLSGTSEGPILARMLHAVGYRVRATVTRAEAVAHLFGDIGDAAGVEVRGFTEASLGEFLDRGEADLVLDATHPFAVRITKIARAVCEARSVPYVRFERPDWTPPAGTIVVDSFAAAAQILPTLGERVMLTIGSKQLKHFAGLHGRMTLFARVLPSPISRQQAAEAGFAEDRIVAMRLPISRETNRDQFAERRVDVLVTKASGEAGGVAEKVLAAIDLAMKVVVIRRPEGTGEDSVSTCEAALEAVRAKLAAMP